MSSIYLLIGALSTTVILVFSVAVVRRALRFARGRRRAVASPPDSSETPSELLIRVQPWQVATEDPFD